MKKQLLAGSALLFAISAFSQNSRMKISSVEEMKALRSANAELMDKWEEKASNAPATQQQGPVLPASEMRSSSSALTWSPFTGSRNIYGVLVSTSKPLQYDDQLNTIAFVHRASKTYSPIPYPSPDPGATSGAIVAQISSNWGNTWDSTCIWNDNTNWARYPQGGIYNPPGNTSVANAYVVGTGPVTTAGSGWAGNFFASKKLDTFDAVASTAPNAQQFISNSGSSSLGKVDFARLDFTSTDDGIVRSLGLILSGSGTGSFQGVKICKGTFNSGVFNWTGDSLSPAATVDGNGDFDAWGRAHMAWNESGTTGYVVFVGARQGGTGNNTEFQPIVYKTSNSGNSWSLMSGINFNDTTKFSKVLKNLIPPQEDPSMRLPFFWELEGIDCTVDQNDRLHIVSTVISGASTQTAGLAFSFSSTVDGQSGYRFDHDSLPPIIYDFYETQTGWDVAIVDTMTSERTGGATTHPGYNENPWDADPGNSGNKVDVDARIQVSRTADGKFIVYTWAESNPQFTTGGKRWNQLPNIKTRVMWVDSNKVLPYKGDLTSTANQGVKNKAHFLNTSTKCALTASNTANGTFTISMPIKVTNSTPLAQLLPNTHWYVTAPIEFQIASMVTVTNSVNEHKISNLNTSLYPNPAQNSANLSLDLNADSKITINIMNAVGQTVKSINAEGHIGSNTVSLDMSGLSEGLYLINVKAGNASVTQKLILK
jgi:hypothetical protein